MTQKRIIINKLREDGYVDRNWALDRRITRLGAIICALNKQGYVLVGRNYGKDYRYTWENKPEKKIVEFYVKDGVRHVRITN